MKWRVVVELVGADGTVQSHEISVGGCGTIDHSADTLGLTPQHGTDLTDRFPRIAEAVRGLPVEQALVDGEAVVFRPDGMATSRPCSPSAAASAPRWSPSIS